MFENFELIELKCMFTDWFHTITLCRVQRWMKMRDMSPLPLHGFWNLQEVPVMEGWPWEVHHQARSISCLLVRSKAMTVFSHSANALTAFSHISHLSSIPNLRSSPTTNHYKDKLSSLTNTYEAVTFNLGWNLISKHCFSVMLGYFPHIAKVCDLRNLMILEPKVSTKLSGRKILHMRPMYHLLGPFIWWAPQSIDIIKMEDLSHCGMLFFFYEPTFGCKWSKC